MVVALFFGAVDALFLPAVGALPPRISTPGQLARIQCLRALAARGSSIIGAPMGGVAVATGGPSLAFAAAGVLFALSLPLLLSLRIRPLPEPETSGEASAAEKAPDTEKTSNAWNDLVGGLRYIRRHSLLGPLMLVIALSELGFVGPLNLGLILLSEQRGWGAAGMGWIVAGFAGGAAGSAPLSYPVTGAAVALWGTGPVFVVSAAVCASGGAMGLALTALRRAELPR